MEVSTSPLLRVDVRPADQRGGLDVVEHLERSGDRSFLAGAVS